MRFGNSKLDTLNKYTAGIQGFIEITALTFSENGNFRYSIRLKKNGE